MSRRKREAAAAAPAKEQQLGKTVSARKKFLTAKRTGVASLLVLLSVFIALGAFSEQLKNAFPFGNKAFVGGSATEPVAPVALTAAPQLSKEYIYAGGRMLAVEDANLNGVSGIVSYLLSPIRAVSGVLLTATNSLTAITGAKGQYSLTLNPGENYTVIPSKTDGVSDISSLDATKVLRHAAANGTGPSALSPNQQKAADASGDGTVTSIDSTMILRYVAVSGRTSQTGLVGTWKFDPAARNYAPFSTALAGENYNAYLIGDANSNWGMTKAQSIDASIQPVVAQPALQISLPQNVAATNGSILEVPIALVNNSGSPIASYYFQVQFDPNVLQHRGIRSIETLSENCNNNLGFMTTSLIVTSTCNISAQSGTLIKLTFNVVGQANTTTGSTPLTFKFSDTENPTPYFETAEGIPFAVARTNGQFTVSPGAAASNLDENDNGTSAKVIAQAKAFFFESKEQHDQFAASQQQQGELEISLPQNAAVAQGDTVLIPVLIRNNSGKKVAGYSFDVRFNPALLQPAAGAMIGTNGTLSEGQCYMEANRETAGRVGIAGACPNGIASTGEGTLVYLRFRIVGQPNNVNQEARSLIFQQTPVFEDEGGNKIEVKRVNGNVR